MLVFSDHLRGDVTIKPIPNTNYEFNICPATGAIISIITSQVSNAVNIQKVSPLEWVIMEEKLSERDDLSIDAEKYIENHNNVLFQGGCSRPTGR